MEATKKHVLWETNLLDPSIERLLASYADSVGCTSGGVPAELLQSASQISQEHSKVHAAGPADCVASNDDNEDAAHDDKVAGPASVSETLTEDLGGNCGTGH